MLGSTYSGILVGIGDGVGELVGVGVKVGDGVGVGVEVTVVEVVSESETIATVAFSVSFLARLQEELKIFRQETAVISAITRAERLMMTPFNDETVRERGRKFNKVCFGDSTFTRYSIAHGR